MSKFASNSLLTMLALVFSIALTYASIELPRVINTSLHEIADFPGYDSGQNIEETESFLESHNIRLVGYTSLLLVIAMIFVGLVKGSSKLASIGALALFLPVFGHFAMSMFFLAGLGALRVVWMPFLDISYSILNLGGIAYIPYMLFVYIPMLFGVDIVETIPFVIMGLGIFLFFLGTHAWFYSRYNQKHIVDFWIYQYSRHPQYLGWIIWSYGVMIYMIRGSTLTHFKLTYTVPSSLPWIISTMVIICVALMEEVKMRNQFKSNYESYFAKTPFMLPLPKFVNRTILFPMKTLLRKNYPESIKDIFCIFFIYLAIVILLSIPFIEIDWLPRSGLWGFPYNVFPFS